LFQDIGINHIPSQNSNIATPAEIHPGYSYRNQTTFDSRGTESEPRQPFIKEFGIESLNIETRTSMIRTGGSKCLPDVKEEPGLESSADLKHSTFKFPPGNPQPSTKSTSEKKRVMSGVRGIVESIRYLKEHRMSSSSGSSRGQIESVRSAKERRPSSGNATSKGHPESISSNEYRPSTRNTSIKGPVETFRAKEPVPFNKTDSLRGVRDNNLTITEAHPAVVRNTNKGSKETIPIQSQHQSKDSIILHKLTDVPAVIDYAQPAALKQPSKALLDAHAIPSLNFSNINLLGRLNDALELRRVSLGSEFADLAIATCHSPKRHSASTTMREKYRSIFLSFDDLATTAEHFPDFHDGPESVELVGVPNSEVDLDRQFYEAHISTLRPLSPDELIEEVQRISVPSVTGLTQRLSELLPSLRSHLGENGDGKVDSDPLESTINEIRELGKVDKEDENDELPEIDENWRDTLLEKGLNVIDHAASGKRLNRPYSVPPPELAELPGSFSFPSAGRLRSMSDSEIDWSLLERINRLARNSNRSLKPKSTLEKDDTRPWNHASNYPWSNSIPFFDIQLPSSLNTGSPRPVGNNFLRPSKLALHLSNDSERSVTGEPSSPGVTEPLPSNTPSNGHNSEKIVPPAAVTHRRHTRKSGLLGSISRRVFHGSGFPTGIALSETSTLNASAHRTNRSDAPDHPVDPGDRYPTTGLSPPSALNLDDVHSFFSDDSNASTHQHNQRPRVGSFRKRLTSSIRARLPGAHQEITKSNRKPSSTIGKHGVSSNIGIDPQSEEINIAAESSTQPPATMSRTEVKAKKLVDRLKSFLWRGGELLRTMSMRRQRQATGDEHWSEKGESLQELRTIMGIRESEYDAGRTAMARDIGSSQSLRRE
jgi:serine/arginine repetitive matrix protein 2